MKVTERTKDSLKFRRQRVELERNGYVGPIEIDWQIARGSHWNTHKIIDVILGENGNSFYYKKELINPTAKA